MASSDGLAALLLFALSACEADPRAPIQVPEHLDAIAVGDCDVITLEVYMGPASPLAADHVVATCADPAVCTTEIRERTRVLVHGAGAGTTTVFVSFDHPTTHEHTERRIPVAVYVPRGGELLHPRLVQPSACY